MTEHDPLHRTVSHMKKAISLRGIGADIKKVEGFNAKLAVIITSGVGTMACAYAFAVLALLGLSTALAPGGIGFVQWLSTAFLQLVLLSIIMVGQSVAAAAADARAAKTLDDVGHIISLLEYKTESGLRSIRDILEEMTHPAAEPNLRINTKEQA